VSCDDKTPVETTVQQIGFFHDFLKKYPETFQLALTSNDILRIFNENKIPSLIGIGNFNNLDIRRLKYNKIRRSSN
jgi:hypothetical protein